MLIALLGSGVEREEVEAVGVFDLGENSSMRRSDQEKEKMMARVFDLEKTTSRREKGMRGGARRWDELKHASRFVF